MRVRKYPNLWRGCVGAWCPSRGPTGTTLFDHSAYARHGTLNSMDAGTDWVASGSGLALDLDGTNDYVSIDNPVKPVRHLTLSAWFAMNATPSFTPLICCPLAASGWASPYVAFLLRLNNATSMEADVGNGSSYSVFSATIPTVVTGVWNHIAMTYDGATVVAYYNGRRLATNTTVTGDIGYASQPIMLGRDGGGPTYANAKLDDCRIYSVTLTDGEVALLASRRGIAYETKPRPLPRKLSAATFKYAWARNSNVLIGM